MLLHQSYKYSIYLLLDAKESLSVILHGKCLKALEHKKRYIVLKIVNYIENYVADCKGKKGNFIYLQRRIFWCLWISRISLNIGLCIVLTVVQIQNKLNWLILGKLNINLRSSLHVQKDKGAVKDHHYFANYNFLKFFIVLSFDDINWIRFLWLIKSITYLENVEILF